MSQPLAAFAANWAAIDALLDEALDLPAPARAAFLQGLQGPRAAHREAVQALLARQAQVETGDFLDQLPRLGSVPDASPHGPAPGDRVGPWRLLEAIGQGGMGTVWQAERVDGLMGRHVALKLPHVAWGGAFAERLAREREILSALAHEHIARLYDAGVDAQGRPWLAMEFVEGVPLDVYVRAQASPLRERVGLLLQVMAAVSYAHTRLIVHRDLKPANVLVTRQGQVKLLDFGVAKLLEGTETRRTALTELAGRALTLDYASPEQIRGEALGTASDVYSLAVMAYELLAGARPYRLKRGTAAEIEEAIAQAEPLLASAAATPPAARKELRGDLDAILNRGLKKAPADRYPSVESFAEDLQRWLRGEPVQARPDKRSYRVAKFVRRNVLAVAMSTALALAIVVGAGLSLWQAREARAQAAFARSEVDGAGAVRELYVNAMMRLSVLGADDPAALQRPHAATQALRQELAAMAPRMADHPGQRDAQLYAVTLQLDYTEEFEAMVDVGREYLASLQAHHAPAYQVIEAYGLLGSALFRLRRYDDCVAMRRAGVAWAPQATDPLTELYRQKVASGLGSILRVLGERTEAERVFARTEDTMARTLPRERFRYENLKQSSMFWLGWDDARTLALAQQAEAGVRGLAESSLVDRAQAERQLGYALLANGRAADAEAVARRALADFVTAYGIANRNSVRGMAAVADAIARQGDYARVASFLEEQRRVARATPDGESPVHARTQREQRLESAWLAGDANAVNTELGSDLDALLTPAALGDNDLASFWPLLALDLTGRPALALDALLRYRGTVAMAGRPTYTWIRLLEVQARLQLAAGDARAALASARDLLKMLSEVQAMTGQAYRNAAELAALAAARLGDAAGAARALAQADAMPTTAPFPSEVERAEASLRRAETLAALGRHAESVAAGRTALAALRTQRPDSPRLVAARRYADDADR